MRQAYIMALDAGTGSGRAVIYDTAGTLCGLGQEEWTHHPEAGVPGGFGFDAGANGRLIDRVIAAALAGAGISADQLVGISTTSMREGMVLFDQQGQVIWACPNTDSRAQDEALDLARSGVADEIYDTAGDWVSITAPARFLWLRRHRPEILQRAVRMGMISDWMTYRLTGRHVTEPSAGSSSALFDLKTRSWSGSLVARIGLDPTILPEVVESGSVIGVVSAACAARSGLAAGTPVVAGGADTQLALLGLGRKAGEATLIGGSFWQMTALSTTPMIDPHRAPRTLCHVHPGTWMTEGIGFLSGLSLRWFRDAFIDPLLRRTRSDISAFDLVEELAAGAGLGAGGVLAMAARPMQTDDWRHPPLGFLGFDITSGEAALGNAARAIMEAGAFAAVRHLAVLEGLTGRRFDQLAFTGGAAQSATWAQIIADATGRPLAIPEVKETTALGCAMLAATGAGLFSGLEDAVQAMASKTERVVEPDPQATLAYSDIAERWGRAVERGVDIAEEGLCPPLWRPAGSRFEARKATA